MDKIPLATSSTYLSIEKFWETVLIYHNRPHLVNRKLLAASQSIFCEIIINSKGLKRVSDLFTRSAILYEVRRLKSLNKDIISVDFVRNIVDCYDKNVKLLPKDTSDFRNSTSGVYISVRILLPRNNQCDRCIEVVVLDKDNNIATFFAVTEFEKIVSAPPFPYDIELTTSMNLRIMVNSFEDADTGHAEWLADKLFDRLIKWTENDVGEKNIVQSLSLVAVDEYCLKYNHLKLKYGEPLVKKWPTKTGTDPQKFVFEDLAIAAYLICVWNKFCADQKIHFVDCGCGNGLLVYILNQEGFNGFGLDVRKRPTWDLYTKNTKLLEEPVDPNSKFEECNWILGNHSDELTPWIPVIALKSSQNTNFFVLPCCPYDFSGKKYIRTNTSISQYMDYMNYIENLCKKCDFRTFVDKLRIPSTKRTCFIGFQREYQNIEEYKKLLNKVNDIVNNKLSENNTFKSRTPEEKVRNCTKLDRKLITRLINLCIEKLLSEKSFIQKSNGEHWNKGTSSHLSELSKIISQEDKNELKKECGGIQTLLRNHRYLFQVNKGVVTIREPYKLDETTKKYKNKPCWFLLNHPDGCLYDSQTCAYNHLPE